jgi:diguanylate cyclase (GGDEF)-like protein/PAS domain S-box-containing protein
MNIKKIFAKIKDNQINPFKELLDLSPAGVIKLDNKGIIRYVNNAFVKLVGFKIENLVNKQHVKLFYEGGFNKAKEIMQIMRSIEYGGIGSIIDYKLNLITRYNEKVSVSLYGRILYDKHNEELGTIGFLFDIRERLKMEEELRSSKEQYQDLIEKAGEGIYIRQEHKFVYFNKKFKEMLGYTDDDEIRELPIFQVIDEEAFEHCSKLYEQILLGKKVTMPYESIFKRKDGSKIYVEVNINPVEYNGKSAVQGFVRDITDKKKLEDKLKEINKKLLELSIKDELTGLYNYRYFIDKLREKFIESKRYNIELSLMVIDIDDFKKVNDTYGHLAGDHILKEIAIILKSNVREIDTVARYGGEEFVILLPHIAIDKAEKIALRICNEISNNKFIFDDNIIRTTVSIGVSSFEKDFLKDEIELIKFADDALYQVKNSGKNNIKSFIKNNAH